METYVSHVYLVVHEFCAESVEAGKSVVLCVLVAVLISTHVCSLVIADG
jgi:hypothetical protein